MLKYRIAPQSFYFILPLFFLLCPSFPELISGGDRFIFALEFGIILLLGNLHIYRYKVDSRVTLLYVCIFLYLIIISLLCDIYTGGIGIRDYIELIKPVSFLLFYQFYKSSNVCVEDIESATFRSFKYVFIILVVYCILEFLFPDIVRPLSYILYKRESVPILSNKAIGSFEQTYQFSYILLLPLSYAYIRFLKYASFANLIVFLLFLFVLLLTQSRSMYLTFAMVMFICLFLPIMHTSVASTLKIMLLILSIVWVALLIFWSYQEELEATFAYAFTGLESMMQGNNNSVNTRTEQINWAIDNNYFIIIGAGIGKEKIMLESFYSLYYYRYGALGMFIYLMIPMYVSWLAYKIAKKEKGNMAIKYYALSVFYLITPMALTSSCHQDTPKISFIFYGLIGFIQSKYQYSKQLNV